MKLTAIMPFRSEDWILGMTARAVLSWVDELVVLDHASTDSSADIIREVARENPGRVRLFGDANPQWNEMAHRQFLLEQARLGGATHIAIVDADEILTGNLIGSIRGTIERMPKGAILQLPWVCLARGIERYYAAGVWFNNWVSCAFEDSPEAHWKARDGYDFHHRQPMGRSADYWRPISQSTDPARHQGGLLHLQFVSERRLKAKQFLYQLTERLRWPNRETVNVVRERYSLAIYESDPARIATQEVPAEWWEPYADLLPHLRIDSEPWQEATCKELVAAHPGLEGGLDSFGVI